MILSNKLSLYALTISTVLMALSSCTESESQKNVEQQPQIIVETIVDSTAIDSANNEVVKLQDEVLGLNKKANKETQTIYQLNQKVKNLNTENDSLKTTINQKNNVISNLASSNQNEISQEELQIRSLMQYLNKAWVNLPGAESTDYFMDLFLPEFSVSMISVGIDDKAVVKTMFKKEFNEMLNEVRKRKDFAVQIGNVDYVYFDGRKDIYSIVYTAIIRSYQDQIAVLDRSFVATVTVKRVEGKWKIGKYSWSSMGHELN